MATGSATAVGRFRSPPERELAVATGLVNMDMTDSLGRAVGIG
jgi:hypothetical protein